MPTVQEMALELGAEAFERMEAEQKLEAAKRVAEEAIRIMNPEQVAKLRRRMDEIEVRDVGGDDALQHGDDTGTSR